MRTISAGAPVGKPSHKACLCLGKILGDEMELQALLMAKVYILVQACIYPEQPLVLTQLLA